MYTQGGGSDCARCVRVGGADNTFSIPPKTRGCSLSSQASEEEEEEVDVDVKVMGDAEAGKKTGERGRS